MSRWFLALAALLGGSVGMASADYVYIIANVGQSKEKSPQTGPGMLGVPPGPG